MSPKKIVSLLSLVISIVTSTIVNASGSYTITTVAGGGTNDRLLVNKAPDSNGLWKATDIALKNPQATVQDSAGNFYIADSDNNAIVKVNVSGFVSKIISDIGSPYCLAIDQNNNIYTVDNTLHQVLKISADELHTKTIIGGNSESGYPVGAAAKANLGNVRGIAVDAQKNVYLSDSDHNVIKKLTFNAKGDGYTLSIIAGEGEAPSNGGYDDAGSVALKAKFNSPRGLSVRGSDVYVADINNHVIRKLSFVGSAYSIATVAGKYVIDSAKAPKGLGDYKGDQGPSTNASLNSPTDVVVDEEGKLYIAEFENSVVRLVDANGITSTIAGNKATGPGYSGDNGPATKAQLKNPVRLSLGNSGRKILIADRNNNLIRQLTPEK